MARLVSINSTSEEVIGLGSGVGVLGAFSASVSINSTSEEVIGLERRSGVMPQANGSFH